MSMIGADNLSLLMGDGGTPETFSALKGTRIVRCEVTQKPFPNPAVSGDAWGIIAAVADRQVLIEAEALASDDAAALRLRMLALGGGAGNFRLELSGAETLSGAAFITSYREVIAAGDIKQIQFRMQSSGALTIA